MARGEREAPFGHGMGAGASRTGRSGANRAGSGSLCSEFARSRLLENQRPTPVTLEQSAKQALLAGVGLIVPRNGTEWSVTRSVYAGHRHRLSCF
jgi:hypothetical protein